MARTCAYRAAGNEAASRAAYEEWRQAVSPTGFSILAPDWEELPESAKQGWREIFRAGHRAYRRVIQRENSEVTPEPGSETPPEWEHKEY